MRRAPTTKPQPIQGRQGYVIVDEFFGSGMACRPAFPPVFHSGESTRCTACGASQWLVGRQSAECGVCGATASLGAPVTFIHLTAKPKG